MPSAADAFLAYQIGREDSLRELIAQATEGLFLCDENGAFLRVGTRFCSLLGYSEDELLRMNIADTYVDDDKDQLPQRMEAARQGQAVMLQRECRLRDGERLWVEVCAAWRPGLGFLGVMRDISSHKRAEATLRASEQRFVTAFENAATGMALIAPDGHWLKVNSALCALLGYRPEEFFGKTLRELTHPDDLYLDNGKRRALLDGHIEFYHQEKRYLHRDGRTIWLMLAISLVRDREGRPLHFIAQAQDVSARVLAEQALRRHAHQQSLVVAFGQQALAHGELEPLLQQAVTLAAEGLDAHHVKVLELSADGKALTLRAGAGWQDGWLGRQVSTLHDGTQNTAVIEGRAPVCVEDFEDFPFRRSGLLSAHEVRSGIDVPIDGSEGLFGVLGVYAREPRRFGEQDISFLQGIAATLAAAINRQRAHEARIEYLELEHRRKEERFRLAAMLERSKDEVVIIVDLRGRVEFVNSAFCRLTGYGENEALGRTTAVLHAEGESSWNAVWQAVLQRQGWNGRLEYRARNGRPLILDARISPVRDEADRITGYVTVGTDITYQEELERQVMRDEKLKSMGYLAAGIAHDFNNILNVILGNCELVGLDLPEGAAPRRNLEQVTIAVERGRSLVEQMLAFARQEKPRFAIVSLVQLAEETAKLMRPGLPPNVAFEVEADPATPAICADPVQLRQIVLNLATNAVHALHPAGGHLWVRIDSLPAEPGGVDKVRMRVMDTGVGMAPELLDRIFDPFFTTRDVGKGTGLGLSVVHGIIERHGGSISVESEPGRGSCFTVILPVVPPYPEGEMAAPAGSPASG